MKKLTKQDGASLDIVGENIKTLKTIFPDAFTEDKVDFDVLRQLLGDVVDEGEEKYGLNWHGKKKARQIALTPSTGTLRPCPEESVDWENTRNLFIEGDNLEVLKLLQKSYAGKVKMIYIDPPYNTGKEFIYPDKFQDNLDTYLRYTGQKGEEGFKVSSNTESSGRYHTNWLNMMYPRLKLARNLLRDNGVIFISIDDNEVASLRKVCVKDLVNRAEGHTVL
jgi:adenine-specific DNA-methyltransferase